MILSIETSTPVCSIALHDEGKLIASQEYYVDKSHSALLPSSIGQILSNVDLKKTDLQAVAVSEGPGSYTGLRIGASIAKGLSFALEIPLIPIPTLRILAEEALLYVHDRTSLVISMLDARRMEVYAAVYDCEGLEVMPKAPLIIKEESFSEYKDYSLVLIGDGAGKCANILSHGKVLIRSTAPQASYMGHLASQLYSEKKFIDPAYFEPEYLKPFQTKKARNRLLQ